MLCNKYNNLTYEVQFDLSGRVSAVHHHQDAVAGQNARDLLHGEANGGARGDEVDDGHLDGPATLGHLQRKEELCCT